jgi:hypothetical protein
MFADGLVDEVRGILLPRTLGRRPARQWAIEVIEHLRGKRDLAQTVDAVQAVLSSPASGLVPQPGRVPAGRAVEDSTPARGRKDLAGRPTPPDKNKTRSTKSKQCPMSEIKVRNGQDLARSRETTSRVRIEFGAI